MKISQLISNPDLSQKHILQKLIIEFLGITREDIWIKSDMLIPTDIYDKIINAYKLITEKQMPLDYAIGHVSFFGKEFIVNQDTLIPRPETEYMIQAVSEYIQTDNSNKTNLVLMDIGSGCGVLGISVLLQNPQNIAKVFFTDISEKALSVAKQNADNHLKGFQQKMFFIHSDLLAFVDDYPFLSKEEIVLVANLPYIPEKMFDQNSPDNVQKREPRVAFVAGEDGLDYYRQLLTQFPLDIKKTIVCFFEMMTRQLEILAKEYPDWTFQEIKTFHFNIRIVKAVYNK